ncbi:hypothetical protein BL253_30315 [Pseudofrankia asymbiotica]|uniref:Uncharacterized protein n=1 Tax=Pseudofrankia asymbiotica TaxID=1834516 RepID=A0A1V2I2P9_9ACTN|nr:hypothetical protein BL253_30315 [Pseudofrankia asymbiotica]
MGRRLTRGCLELVEVERPGGLLQDLLGLAHIGLEVDRGSFRRTGQQRAGLNEHQGVFVDVDDPALGRDPLGDPMSVVLGRQPGTDVEELTDSRLLDEETHHPDQRPP